MPTWWGKSSSKEDKRKASKESFIDVINRKLKFTSDEKSTSRLGGSRRRRCDAVSERGSLSRVPSRSSSPSTQVSRCQSFVERPHAQPLPLPGLHPASVVHANSGINASTRPGVDKDSRPSLLFPLPKPEQVSNKLDHVDAEGDIATASISSDSSIYSDDPSDSRLPSSLTSDYENGQRTAANSPSSIKHTDQLPVVNQDSKEILKPANISFNHQYLSTSPKRGPLSNHVQNLQIPQRGALSSAPDSSMSSPSRSPIWNSGPYTGKPFTDIAFLGSGQCSSPGSGHNSGHNSVGGDMSGQLFWPQSRCSPECSPIPSPRMTSPGPSSRIHSGAVTPLHPRAAGAAIESPTSRPDDVKQQSHRLPLPPIAISPCLFSPAYSAATSPSLPRSPGRAENPTSPGSRWKKGRLLGRGTFGHVYLGFNSESGEMCAMKEVTLFSDDAKSKESAQQLGQEIMLLSRLRHPNIVRYYGFETVDDKLYIYLEYVSGGSIYKLLQEYGQFGESAIRNFTQQILSGLAYLHAKNTVHRDIKGANILVDPNGRVKLADFGMAKHITGSSCPLSFKGSPYWMAPEVIKYSNGCNLAVDIWSLGCTVLEMATTKPPWSQYEGVAAMFKIGNSKELPAIPDSLSDDGKDFVRQCLQRNPSHRPTAAWLLEHPFVKNAAPLERPNFSADASDPSPAVANAMRTLEIGNTRNLSCIDSEGTASLPCRGLKIGSGSSDAHTPRNMSCPVSPMGSPLLHPRSPQHLSGRMSPSPISSPHTASGSSTPLTGGSGAIPFHHQKQPMTYLHEGIGITPRSQNSFYGNASNPYQEPEPDLFRGISQASNVFQEIISSDSGAFGKQYGRSGHVDHRELYDGQPVLADHVSQQLLRDHVKLKPSLDLNTSSSMLGRNGGF
ncbi:mitogen-activated protein kinase kinase kinase YODA-like isoform X1 [Durio zibethinus]|uniref:mitogen-activated protein kinase kinase kinase n=1 Tax=Durio zibethinus TaxID=66656 RepID=A0A6P5WWA2_DURZI|nr:mitogen-activated protein kinase kinase kinase YODA-like isoform X1 [Durio zibethinus]XP_022720425.1 mitogen-activated protein kinase kinase kinase YODA-like isoform X1 [Durio zibethinus]XP_022720434.1 mitogen-activated protein kinase kinase kinase YODA-like isoform X1 [Durio zibethinus]XP_022720443.1 mitogen-activated protein kinase kinase kinase YODA-like isoform X1 [Durio zibethinus]